MRHQGLLEAQALWLLGVEPVWDEGGRVTGVKLVPRKALGRAARGRGAVGHRPVPRPLPQHHEASSPRPRNWPPRAGDGRQPRGRATPAPSPRSLRAQGLPDKAAQAAAETRIYSSESGKYGTGLDDATLATDTWKGKAGRRPQARAALPLAHAVCLRPR
jgi:cobaltochelatase CobN